MEKSKYDVSSALLSSREAMETNNNKQDTYFHPLDVERVGYVKKSKVPIILGWTCIACIVLLAIGAITAVVIISQRGEPVPQNQTSTPSSSTVSSTISTVSSTSSSSTSSQASSTASSTVSPTPSQKPVTSPAPNTTVTQSTTSSSSTTVTVTTASTTPENTCETDQFRCSDGTCISNDFVCDGAPHCPNGEEEHPNCTCSDSQYRCASGQCVPAGKRCDGLTHCEDKSDEVNCSNCNGFQCASGLCLWSRSVRCNDKVECEDLSDEKNSVCDSIRSTQSAYEQCDNGMWILWMKWCDGVDDCYDNSDEKYCSGALDECAPDERTCGNDQCVLAKWWCDGHVDCTDQSDETDCGICDENQFSCSDHSCVNTSVVCNGINDCPTGTDELNCVELKSSAGLSGSAGVVAMQSNGESLPVCSEAWSQSVSDTVCKMLGQEGSISHQSVDANTTGFLGSQFLHINKTKLESVPLLQALDTRSSCEGGQVVSLTCQPKVCGKRKVDTITSFIAGGDEATDGKWPWMASLSLLGKEICGASLISDQWVLTAAHCIVKGSTDYSTVPSSFDVMLGSNIRTREVGGNVQRIAVDKIILHPNTERLATGATDWDFALLHLSRPANFSDYVQPVCLPDQGDSFPSQSLCYLAGWGYVNPDITITVTNLREARMIVWDDESCKTNTVTGEESVNINSTLCAGYKSGLISACQGDSGGPLMCQTGTGHWRLAGVMSSGSQGCDGRRTNKANRFGRVSSIVNWINEVMSS